MAKKTTKAKKKKPSKKVTKKTVKRKPAPKRVKKVVKKKVTPKKRVIKKKVAPKKTTKKKAPVRKKTAKKAVVKTAPKKRRQKFSNRPVVKIKVMGVGGGGGNALTRMSKDPIRGVEFIAVNTDLQDLETCEARKKIHIGKAITRGLGAGMNPELGQQSAEENREDIESALQNTDMVFITAGMGGGTGTGAAPVIADIARDMGILTVAVVTKPFAFEGSARMRIAEEGLTRLRDKVDTLLVIPNDKIFNIIDASTPVLKAFDKIDEILKHSVRGVADMIASSGLVNVDFADVSAVMKDAGVAVVGVGVARGKERAAKAVDEAMNSPLLDTAVDGARGVLFSVAGGRDMKMSEVNEAAELITSNVDAGAKIIFGAYNDRRLRKGDLKITLIATGFNGSHQLARDHSSFGLFTSDEDEFVENDLPETKEEDNNSAKEDTDTKVDKGKDDSDEKSVPTKDEDEDIWEIPSFLRRRKRR